MIPALVLTAGFATRLRPLSLVRAKAAIPVAGEPLARRILRQLAAAGVTEAVLNLHHLPHTLTGLIGDGSDVGVRVRYSWEMPLLGSAGGPRLALPLLRSDRSDRSTFLIVNGDTLTDVNLAALVDAHRRSGALVTMAVVPHTEPEKYGGVLVDDQGVVAGLARRTPARTVAPSHPRTVTSYHFVGVQVAEAEAFEAVADGTPAQYPEVIRNNPGAVRAYVTSASFMDIGTPADYLRTALLLEARERRSGNYGDRSRIHPTARVVNSVLWDDVHVEAGAVVRECVVCDGATIPGDTAWHGVTIRVADDLLATGEKRIGDLAVADI